MFFKNTLKFIESLGNIIIDITLKVGKIVNKLSKHKPNLKISKLSIVSIKFFILGIIFTVIFLFVPYIIFQWFKELPSPNLLVTQGSLKSTKIYDRNGELLYEIYIDRQFNPVKLQQVPSNLILATLAVEDAEFFSHAGIRIESMLRAAKKTLLEENLQGGSTITQQLIKNVLLTPERTFSRKIKEVVLAVIAETTYSKNEILELYLNNIPYGGTAWGVQSASHKYFAKEVWELSLAESALLAGLPTAPTAYSPLSDIGVAKERQKHTLDRMETLGFINHIEAEEAYNQELIFADQSEYIRAPHFVNYVRSQLEQKYGKRFVDLGGLTIVTTLDLDLHEKVQQIVSEEVERSSYLNISNGAAVVLDAQSADILAYVGSKDYFAETWGAYDIVTALRQPGSSIKVLTYSLALAAGYTPVTIINDSAVTFKFPGSNAYRPVNYDGKYHGNVTLRSAFANSYNIPAVKVAYKMGPDNIVSLGKEMGLTNWQIDASYGLSVTLGGKEVRLLDLANVYGTVARKGMYKDSNFVISIHDSRGYGILENGIASGKRVLSDEVSYLIWDILSDNKARAPAFGSRSSLVLPGYKVAAKTGTTDNLRDNWTFGFTPSYVVGVWVGNNDNTPMNRRLASGLSGAAPIWNRVFSVILGGQEDEVFEKPEGVFVMKDTSCNKTEVFIKGSNIPKSLCPKKEEKEDK